MRQRDADSVRVTANAQVKAFGGPKFQLTKELAQILESAIRDSKNPLVPQVVIGQQDGRGGNAVDALLGMLLSSKTEPAEKSVSR